MDQPKLDTKFFNNPLEDVERFKQEYEKDNLPLYDYLVQIGASDEALEQTAELLEACKKAYHYINLDHAIKDQLRVVIEKAEGKS